MIKAIGTNKDIIRMVTVNGGDPTMTNTTKTYYQTTFVADATSDIATMNADGSEYLNYPAGSCVLDSFASDVYILNASQTEYVKL